MDYLNHSMDHAQRHVTGSADIVLHKGNVLNVGRSSPLSLYVPLFFFFCWCFSERDFVLCAVLVGADFFLSSFFFFFFFFFSHLFLSSLFFFLTQIQHGFSQYGQRGWIWCNYVHWIHQNIVNTFKSQQSTRWNRWSTSILVQLNYFEYLEGSWFWPNILLLFLSLSLSLSLIFHTLCVQERVQEHELHKK